MNDAHPTSAPADDAPTPATRKGGDGRRLVKTRYPGIYLRVNAAGEPCGYVAIYRAGGKQRKKVCRTLAEARRFKREHEAADDRGEYVEPTKVRFRAFLTEWIDSYAGNGKRGFRENTRAEYRRLLDQYAHQYFSERLLLKDLRPRDLSRFVAWLADESKQGKRLSDSSIANAVVPLRAALASAVRDDLIRHNPASGLVLPMRERIEEDEDEAAKVLSREQLAAFLAIAPTRYRTFFHLLACTGLRVSEGIGLQVKHARLDGSSPHLQVRRAIVRGKIEPPKSKHGRRNVALDPATVSMLRQHVAALADASPDALMFPTRNGTPLNPDNLRSRVVKTLMQEVGAPWAGFHTLRHTFASLQLAEGVNVLQLSRALGHHSPAFTLGVYTHLLPGEEAPPLVLADVLARSVISDVAVILPDGPVAVDGALKAS